MSDTLTPVMVEDHIWCTECGEPHAANLQADPPTLHWHDPEQCIAIGPAKVSVQLPEDWDRTYYAMYATRGWGGGVEATGYDLYLKCPPLQECHRPMYYLESGR